MKYIVFIVVFALSAINCYSQIHVSGAVRDSVTSSPLGFTYISVGDTNYLCDEEGRFDIQDLSIGTHTLRFYHVGCEPQSRELLVRNDTQIVVLLQHHVHEFEEAIAVGRRDDNITQFTHRIGTKELQRRGATSLGEALQNESGITFLQTGNAVFKPVVQGMHSSRVLIINDNSKQEGQQWGTEHGPEIDPLSAGTIEVLKGASTLKYGNDGLGGIIRMSPSAFADSTYTQWGITTQALSNPIGGMMNLKFERNNEVKHFGSRASLSFKRTSDTYAPNYVLSNTAFSQLSGSYYASKTMNESELSVSSSAFIQKFGILASSHIGNLTDLNAAIASDTPFIVNPLSFELNTPYQDIQHYSGKLKYVHKHTDIGTMTSSYTFQQNKRQEFDNHGTGDRSALDLNLITNQLLLQQEKTWEHFKMESGISGEYQRHVFNGRYFIPNYHRWKGGLYAIGTKEWDKVKAEAGMRYDMQYSSTFRPENSEVVNDQFLFQGLSANMGGRWRPNEDVLVFANASTRFRAPDINELFSDGLHHGSAAIEVGDIDLNEERVYSLNVGLHYNHNKWRIVAEPYLHYFKNYIYLKPQGTTQLSIRGAFPVFAHTQVDARYFGIDLDARYRLKSQWTLQFNASFLRVNDITNDAYIFGIPPITLGGDVVYQAPSSDIFSSSSFTLSPNYTFKQYWTNPNEDFAEAPEGYALLNAEWSADFKNSPTSISLRAVNLLNATYRNYLNRYRYFADDQGIQFFLTLNFLIQ